MPPETPETLTPTVPTARVAQYGLLAPIAGEERVRHQMRAAARYYNQLIALERCRRTVYRELRKEHVDLSAVEARVLELAEELSDLRDVIKSQRKEARRRVVTDALNARAKEVHAALREARAERKAALVAAREDEALSAAVKQLDERAKVWAKALRNATEAWWGSYLLVEASAEQARKAMVDPTFRRARGRERVSRTGQGSAEGRIGVQIQHGITLEELLSGEDTRLRLTDAPLSFRGGRTSARGLRRCATKLLHVRVGSDGRKPIWAVFPLILHRPIPEGAIIKGAAISLRVLGHREQWIANLTYTREAVPMPQRAGVVALDLGWRKRPDASLRIAYWVDGDGQHGEITMPSSIRERLKKARDLQEIQDVHFNRAVRWIERWFATSRGKKVPEWLEAELVTLPQWRSHERLRRLVFRWRDARFAGDRAIFEALERWLHRSRHLYQYQEGVRRGALLARREAYRIAAVQLARTYGTVVIEKFDLAKAKRLKAPEAGEDAPQAQRAQLHAGAPGELRQAIVQAVEREGGVIVPLNAVGTTSHCHECGGVCSWDQGAELYHRCEHCTALWDQDHNAAINLLRAFGRERPGDASIAAPARKISKRAERFRKRYADESATPGQAD